MTPEEKKWADLVVETICEVSKINKEALLGRDMHRPIREARMMAMTLIREVLGWSSAKIGTYFDRTHSDVLHACRITKGLRLAYKGLNFRYLDAQRIVQFQRARCDIKMIRVNESRLAAKICRQSFFEFLKEFWDILVAETPVFNWHIPFLCDEMQKVAERVFNKLPKEYDLIINIPPGSTKSTIVSQAFPAWTWTRMPSARHINASYAYALALRDSVRCRDVVQSDKYKELFADIYLRDDENMKGLFVNNFKGGRLAVGVKGQVTGYHGHFLSVDDPLNPEQSYSEAELRTVNRWMETTLPSRGIYKSDTPLILCQQRLSIEDPSGEMITRGGRIRHICIPGELTDNVSPVELREFYEDGLFDPVRMPRRVLKEMEQKLGSYGYASQILQDPVPAGGGMFDVSKFNEAQELPKGIVRKVRSWDKAGTPGSGAYTVGTKEAVDRHGRYWVEDVVRGQWGSIEREQKILETAHEDGIETVIRVEVEGGSGGKESGESTMRNLAGFRVILFHPTGTKEARAYGYSSQVGGGNVFLLNRHWTKAFKEEHRFFPFSKYKDQVDTAADAFNFLSKSRRRIGSL